MPAYLQSDEAKAGWTIGYDPRLLEPSRPLERLKAAAAKAGRSAEARRAQSLDAAWGEARFSPAHVSEPVSPHPAEFSGEDSASKRERVGRSLADQGADAALITAPASGRLAVPPVHGGDVIRSPCRAVRRAILNADGNGAGQLPGSGQDHAGAAGLAWQRRAARSAGRAARPALGPSWPASALLARPRHVVGLVLRGPARGRWR